MRTLFQPFQRPLRLALLLGLAAALPTLVLAQAGGAFQVTSVSPAPHSVSASRTAPYEVQFSQAVDPTTLSGIRMCANGKHIAKAVFATQNRVVITPATSQYAGEEISLTVPASLRSCCGPGGGPIVRPYVAQFRTAAGGSANARLFSRFQPAQRLAHVTDTAPGDVNGDGYLDVLALDGTTNEVNVLINNRASLLLPAIQKRTVPNGCTRVVCADVDNDGDLDLLCCSPLGRSVSVCLNNGTGTFAAPVAVGGNWQKPNDVCVGDMDADGYLDITVCDGVANTITTCLNNGSGGFPAASTTSLACPGNPVSLACADFDNDGDLDVAASCRDTGELAILLWQLSQWTAGLRVSLPAGSNPAGVCAADFTGDGRCDLAVACAGGSNGGATVASAVRVLPQSSTGGFSVRQTLECCALSLTVSCADLDGDGDLDLLCPDAGGSGVVTCRNGGPTATTTFSDGNSQSAGRSRDKSQTWGMNPSRVCPGDFDNDGDMDAVACCPGSGDVALLTNQVPVRVLATSPAPGAVVARATSTVTVTYGAALDAADRPAGVVRCDTRGTYTPLTRNAPGSDPAVQPFSWGVSNVGTVRGQMSHGRAAAGSLLPPVQWSFDKRPDPSDGTFVAQGGASLSLDAGAVMCAADLDGDGLNDVVSVQRTGNGGWNIKVSRRTATGWAAPVTTPDPTIPADCQPAFVRCADMDGDGTPDIVVVSVSSGTGNSRCDVYRCPSGACIKRSGDVITGTVTDLILADLDGDGQLEALMPSPGSNTHSGKGITMSGIKRYSNSGAASLLAFAPGGLNGEGRLVAGGGPGGGPHVKRIPVDAAGDLHEDECLAEPLGAAVGLNIAAADLDGDGVEEVLVPVPTTNSFKIRKIDHCTATGAYPSEVSVSTGAGSSPTLVCVGDVDGDGDRDLVAMCPGTSSLWIGLNDGRGVFGSSSSLLLPAIPKRISLGDCDNDGLADVLVHLADNTVRLFEVSPPAAQDLFISTTQTIPTGTYRNITILDGGDATVAAAGPVTCSGQMTVGSGGSLHGPVSFTGGGELLVAPGATLYINDPAGFSADGSSGQYRTLIRWTGNAWCSSSCSVVYEGSSAQVTGTGLPSSIFELTVADNVDLTPTNPITITGRLIVKSGCILRPTTGPPMLTLRSTADGTALVVNEGSGVITGNVTVQRYIPSHVSPGSVGYYHISPPIGAATVAAFGSSGFPPVVNAAFNTSATPSLVRPFPTVYYYDQSRLATAVNNLSLFDKGWTSPAALTEALVPGRGYTANMPSNRTLAFTGVLNNGDFTLNLGRTSGNTATDGGWSFVGNPYPSPLDWSLVLPADRPGLDASMYVFQNDGQYSGRYLTYANGIGTASPTLALGQGFWVRVSQGRTSGSLTLRNSQRNERCWDGTCRRTLAATLQNSQSTVNYPDFSLMQRGGADRRPQLELTLSGNGRTDAAFVYFEAGATVAMDAQFDAAKLPNTNGLNLATLTATGQALAIDGRPALTATTVVPLQVGVPSAGSYSFTAAALSNFAPGSTLYLRDALLGTRTRLTAGLRYAFTMTGGTAPGRFALEATAAGALAATPSQVLAAGLQLYPNPAQGSTTLEVPAAPGAPVATVQLTDALGRLVQSQTLPLPATGLSHTVKLTGLAPGIYALRVSAGTAATVRRLVVE